MSDSTSVINFPTSRSNPVMRRLVVFELAEQAYAVGLEELREIIPYAELSRPPHSPALLAGFLNDGGSPIPVIALRHLFKLPERSLELYTPLVVMRGPREPIALVVDRVSQALVAPEHSIMQIGEGHA